MKLLETKDDSRNRKSYKLDKIKVFTTAAIDKLAGVKR